MATFVLVHGAWRGSWCWKRVRRALLQQGHEVFTPTLTGLGERSHLLSETLDLQTHTLDVLNLIQWEELNDFVLCGHSYGGMVISGVADRVPERIRSLVFLDAFVPEHGESVADFAPVSGGGLIDGWKSAPISGEAFGVNLADRAWVARQCTVHPCTPAAGLAMSRCSIVSMRRPNRAVGRPARSTVATMSCSTKPMD